VADERLFEALAYWNLWGEGAFETGIPRESRKALLPWLERPEVVAICCAIRWATTFSPRPWPPATRPL